jgi:hypothetical protein
MNRQTNKDGTITKADYFVNTDYEKRKKMKLRTIEKYIKYTTIPYTELLERAEKKGLNIEYKDESILISNENGHIELFPFDFYDINLGMNYIVYSY